MIIECAYQNSSTQYNNADWVNVFAKPVLLDSGGLLDLKFSSIEYTDTNAFTSIKIKKDLRCEFTFGYYVQANQLDSAGNPTLPNRTLNPANPVSLDYEFYVVRDKNTKELITNTITIELDKGTYTPNNLAKILTEKFAETNVTQGAQTPTFNNNLLITNRDNAGVVDKSYFAQDNNTDFHFFDNNPVYIGANEGFTIIFDEDSNRFLIENCHTAFYDNLNPFNPIISLDKVVGVDTFYFYKQAQSGVFLTSMNQDAIFLMEDVMGFDSDGITIPVVNNELMTALRPGINMTTELVTLESQVDKLTGMEIPLNPTNNTLKSASNQFRSIHAVENYSTNVFSGFFLIEIEGVNTTMVSEEKVFSSIMGINSNYFSNAGFVSSYEGSLVFENKSGPQLLSGFRIRILDPITKQPLDEIGRNNVIYLEIRNPTSNKNVE